MAYRNKGFKKTKSLTVKASQIEYDEIALAVEISGGEFSPSVRDAALAWARTVITESRKKQISGKACFGVVDGDGEIKYRFG